MPGTVTTHMRPDDSTRELAALLDLAVATHGRLERFRRVQESGLERPAAVFHFEHFQDVHSFCLCVFEKGLRVSVDFR